MAFSDSVANIGIHCAEVLSPEVLSLIATQNDEIRPEPRYKYSPDGPVSKRGYLRVLPDAGSAYYASRIHERHLDFDAGDLAAVAPGVLSERELEVFKARVLTTLDGGPRASSGDLAERYRVNSRTIRKDEARAAQKVAARLKSGPVRTGLAGVDSYLEKHGPHALTLPRQSGFFAGSMVSAHSDHRGPTEWPCSSNPARINDLVRAIMNRVPREDMPRVVAHFSRKMWPAILSELTRLGYFSKS